MPNPSIVAPIVSEISAFIRTDGQVKKFTLTTAASALAIGVVLSQEGKRITFISKTPTKTEQLYATNKKKLLAIVLAFKNLQHRDLYRSPTSFIFHFSKKSKCRNEKMVFLYKKLFTQNYL